MNFYFYHRYREGYKGVNRVDFERARQIVQSGAIINVLLNGSPVWIESLDAEKNKATVSPMDGTQNVLEVPIGELVESPSPLQM